MQRLFLFVQLHLNPLARERIDEIGEEAGGYRNGARLLNLCRNRARHHQVEIGGHQFQARLAFRGHHRLQ